jgi:predicted acyltransferase
VKVAAHHLESLDVFRGVTIAAMILVNNPGDWGAVFPPLVHAYWTGCTFADVVFPWFVFIMGFALPFALARRQARGDAVRGPHWRIASRVAWLIGLGLVLNAVAGWPAVLPLRLPGVLQRIALSYLVASVVVLHLDVAGWIVLAALLLLGHWALLTLVPFGPYPGGTLTPEHNLARYIDTIVLGRHAATRALDPEGLLGGLSTAATALIGAITGQLVRRRPTDGARLRLLILWTGSYVLVVTGLAMLVFAATYAVIDVLRVRGWARPFLWLGVNPLAIYFLSEIVGHLLEDPWLRHRSRWTTPKSWLVWGQLEPALHPLRAEWASLIFAVAFVAVWIAVAGTLYQRRIRIQV